MDTLKLIIYFNEYILYIPNEICFLSMNKDECTTLSKVDIRCKLRRSPRANNGTNDGNYVFTRQYKKECNVKG